MVFHLNFPVNVLALTSATLSPSTSPVTFTSIANAPSIYSCGYSVIFNPNNQNQDLGACYDFTLQNGAILSGCGYSNIGGSIQPAHLYSKTQGGDENGVGMANDGQHEITALDFVQLDLINIPFQFKLLMGSTTNGETYQIWGSNVKGSLGSVKLVDSPENSQYFSVPGIRNYRYLSVTAGGVSGANVLLNSLLQECTFNPTNTPTRAPSSPPTFRPSFSKTPTSAPTKIPSILPTFFPSSSPSTSPSLSPSNRPTLSPSVAPTLSPTSSPSMTPTNAPTKSPTLIPTFTPTILPTAQPTVLPSILPTLSPFHTPTVPPTLAPTKSPTLIPTFIPTILPTAQPTVLPSILPTLSPFHTPTVPPTLAPTPSPSLAPSMQPSVDPSLSPTELPSIIPTVNPSFAPSNAPSDSPTLEPTAQPTVAPTLTPSSRGEGLIRSCVYKPTPPPPYVFAAYFIVHQTLEGSVGDFASSAARASFVRAVHCVLSGEWEIRPIDVEITDVVEGKLSAAERGRSLTPSTVQAQYLAKFEFPVPADLKSPGAYDAMYSYFGGLTAQLRASVSSSDGDFMTALRQYCVDTGCFANTQTTTDMAIFGPFLLTPVPSSVPTSDIGALGTGTRTSSLMSNLAIIIGTSAAVLCILLLMASAILYYYHKREGREKEMDDWAINNQDANISVTKNRKSASAMPSWDQIMKRGSLVGFVNPMMPPVALDSPVAQLVEEGQSSKALMEGHQN